MLALAWLVPGLALALARRPLACPGPARPPRGGRSSGPGVSQRVRGVVANSLFPSFLFWLYRVGRGAGVGGMGGVVVLWCRWYFIGVVGGIMLMVLCCWCIGGWKETSGEWVFS